LDVPEHGGSFVRECVEDGFNNRLSQEEEDDDDDKPWRAQNEHLYFQEEENYESPVQWLATKTTSELN
tara:strand:+ start:269 stop:472 length:204 start_codon:yes stop_codon:yes gene_type:complete